MAQLGYLHVPLAWHSGTEWIRKCAQAINSLRDGRINSVGTVTLSASTTTTTLSDRRIGPDSYIGLRAKTDTARTAAASGYPYPSAQAKGSATLTHDSQSDTDRTFTFVVLG
jgi:hypothetical protein